MTRASTVTAVGATLALLAGCGGGTSSVTGTTSGSGTLVTHSRPVQGFTGVSVSGAGHLIVEQTGVESLEITAEDNLLPLIRSEVVNGQLILGFESGVSVSSTREVLYRLTVRELTAIEASGASRVEITDLSTPALATVLSGASALTASGTAGTHGLVVSGASRCEAPNLSSRVVTAAASGASYALVRASDVLGAAASGASTLEYYGDPVVTTSEISGGSSIRRLGP